MEAVVPEFTNSNFFTFIILVAIIEVIIVVLVSAFIIVKRCFVIAFGEFEESGVNCIDADIVGASIVVLTAFIIKVAVMPVLACDTFAYFVLITIVVFSC